MILSSRTESVSEWETTFVNYTSGRGLIATPDLGRKASKQLDYYLGSIFLKLQKLNTHTLTKSIQSVNGIMK